MKPPEANRKEQHPEGVRECRAPEKPLQLRTKARSDSKIHGLPRKQQKLIDQWLFQENLSYGQVQTLCADDLELSISISALQKYYQREKSRWDLQCKVDERSEKNKGETRDGETRYQALLDRMIDVALDTADEAENPLERRIVTDYAKVLISARRESHEALRAATTREKFEFDAATACLIHQTKVQAIAADEAMDDGERIRKIREQLFGPNLPESNTQPAEPKPSADTTPPQPAATDQHPDQP